MPVFAAADKTKPRLLSATDWQRLNCIVQRRRNIRNGIASTNDLLPGRFYQDISDLLRFIDNKYPQKEIV